MSRRGKFALSFGALIFGFAQSPQALAQTGVFMPKASAQMTSSDLDSKYSHMDGNDRKPFKDAFEALEKVSRAAVTADEKDRVAKYKSDLVDAFNLKIKEQNLRENLWMPMSDCTDASKNNIVSGGGFFDGARIKAPGNPQNEADSQALSSNCQNVADVLNGSGLQAMAASGLLSSDELQNLQGAGAQISKELKNYQTQFSQLKVDGLSKDTQKKDSKAGVASLRAIQKNLGKAQESSLRTYAKMEGKINSDISDITNSISKLDQDQQRLLKAAQEAAAQAAIQAERARAAQIQAAQAAIQQAINEENAKKAAGQTSGNQADGAKNTIGAKHGNGGGDDAVNGQLKAINVELTSITDTIKKADDLRTLADYYRHIDSSVKEGSQEEKDIIAKARADLGDGAAMLYMKTVMDDKINNLLTKDKDKLCDAIQDCIKKYLSAKAIVNGGVITGQKETDDLIKLNNVRQSTVDKNQKPAQISNTKK